MNRQFQSDFQISGGSVEQPNYVYYNCDIVNNRTDDINEALHASPDPQIQFNETRDTALLKDCSEYEFSIIRFTMNGPNMDLPLFIPNILTGQHNVDLTTYYVSMSFQTTFQRYEESGIIYYPCSIAPNPFPILWEAENLNPILAPIPREPYEVQDISTRYYWATTYQHMVNLVNKAIAIAHHNAYVYIATWWLYPEQCFLPVQYTTYENFTAHIAIPKIIYNESTKKFEIFGDSDAFGQRLTPFVNEPPSFTQATESRPPCARLFFNTNLFGLFSNFPNVYWNRTDIPESTYDGVVYPAFPVLPPSIPYPPAYEATPYTYPLGRVDEGYTYEIKFPNKYYQNVADYRLSPYSGVFPLGYVPEPQRKVYWNNIQEFASTDSLWSPISAIVFTTSLIPVKTENASQPNVLGTSNIGNSAPTSQSAFEPVITDISLDMSSNGAEDYRKFIYYAPAAEYRMSSFTSSRQELRNFNIRVFYKNRLDSKLYPINMYNLSSVNLKVMFRKRTH